MRFLRDKSKEDLENARNSRRRELVNETERIICRALYDALDGYLI